MVHGVSDALSHIITSEIIGENQGGFLTTCMPTKIDSNRYSAMLEVGFTDLPDSTIRPESIPTLEMLQNRQNVQSVQVFRIYTLNKAN